MLKNFPRVSLSLLIGFALCAGVLGDTVVLTSGEKIEGKITKETDAEVTIETNAGGIIDERTVKKTEIKSMSKATPDEAPYQAIRNFKLGANSMTATQYDSYIGPMKGFLNQHPQSKYKGDVEKTLTEFEKEKARVSSGERKLNGKWLSKEEVERESYQINGAIAFNYLGEQVARGDLTGAMNTFDQIEQQYPGSRSYVDAVEYVRRLLPTLKQQAEARIARLPAENAERERAVQLARAGEKAQVQAELEREKQASEAALAQARQQNLKWPPFLQRNEEALRQIVQLSTEETKRLAEIDVAKRRESLRLAEQARASIASKDLTAAEENLKKAQEAWSENEVIQRLEKDLIAAREVAASEPAPAPAETTPSETAATDGESAPSADDSGAAPAATSDDEEPSNPIFRVVIAIVIVAFLYAAWKAYSSIRKKANEVIE